MSEVTQILNAIERGEKQAAADLLPLVYDELRKLAALKLAQEKPGQTLQPTALVHEAYLRLLGPTNADGFANRRHFFGAAAEAMRRILIDHARRHQAHVHGGAMRRKRLAYMDAAVAALSHPAALLEINDALEALAVHDAVAAELFKLRYFAGLSVEEAAETLTLSRSEAYRKWTFLKAWLACELVETGQ